MRRSMRRATALPPAPRAPAGTPAAATASSAVAAVSRGVRRGRIVGRHLDQVGDLLRGDREEPDPGEDALERGGEPQHQMVPAGQVRALMGQHRVELAAMILISVAGPGLAMTAKTSACRAWQRLAEAAADQ